MMDQIKMMDQIRITERGLSTRNAHNDPYLLFFSNSDIKWCISSASSAIMPCLLWLCHLPYGVKLFPFIILAGFAFLIFLTKPIQDEINHVIEHLVTIYCFSLGPHIDFALFGRYWQDASLLLYPYPWSSVEILTILYDSGANDVAVSENNS